MPNSIEGFQYVKADNKGFREVRSTLSADTSKKFSVTDSLILQTNHHKVCDAVWVNTRDNVFFYAIGEPAKGYKNRYKKRTRAIAGSLK